MNEITPQAEAKLKQIGDEVKQIIEVGNQISVANDDDYGKATSFVKQLKTELRDIEKARKELVDPLRQTMSKINEQFKFRTEPMEKIEGLVKEKMTDYQREVQRKADEEAAKLRKEQEEREEKARKELEEANRKAREATDEAEKERLEALAKEQEEKAEEAAKPLEIEKPETSMRTENALASTKKVWTFEITDPSKIPSEYLVIDEKKIRQAVRDGVREIEGVKIFQDIQVAIR